MNRHARRARKLQDESTNVGRQKKCVLVFGCCAHGFLVYPKEPPPEEFARLVRTHSDRLRALLDRPVILAVHWDEGDRDAVVQIMPAGEPGTNPDPRTPFEEFALAFPACGGAVAVGSAHHKPN
jgi:hypothetical protein